MAVTVLEGAHATITVPIIDGAQAAIAKARIVSLSLTYTDSNTGRTINARARQNALDANAVSVSSTGVITWTMQPADTVILDRSLAPERHLAHFAFVYDTSLEGSGDVAIDVTNQAGQG